MQKTPNFIMSVIGSSSFALAKTNLDRNIWKKKKYGCLTVFWAWSVKIFLEGIQIFSNGRFITVNLPDG